MNIFYYSVHQILEFDEVALFRSLGHNVFSLGLNSQSGSLQPFRDEMQCSAIELHLHKLYSAAGGKYNGRTLQEILPRYFIENFSLSIIMHDVEFIEDMWSRLRSKPVVWRTIGQGVEAYEGRLAPLRRDGLNIVRCSPLETQIVGSLGENAVIRFAKDESTHGNWTGETQQILSFANLYASRYPCDADDYIKIAEELPFKLGGVGNERFPQAIGLVSETEQRQLYRTSRAYLYASGLDIPYTLNFMEAWMTGLPVIVYAPLDRIGRWFEIDRLIDHGRNGLVCRTIEETRAAVRLLLADHALAARIGRAGRQSAVDLFGYATVGHAWRELFSSLTAT